MGEPFDESYVEFVKSVISYSFNLDTNHIHYSYPRLVDSDGQPLVVQPSLFPMVWPTIYFALEEESGIVEEFAAPLSTRN